MDLPVQALPFPGLPAPASRRTGAPGAEPALRRAGPTLWAVAAGQGGVGQSVLCTNLAIGLAQTGPRAIAVDLDLAGPNLHALFGCTRARHTLADALCGRIDGLSNALVQTSVPGVRLLPGAHPADRGDASLGATSLVASLRSLDAGHVVLDLGASRSADTLAAFAAADRRLLVVTPDAGALAEARRFLAEARARFAHRAPGGFEVSLVVNRAELAGEREPGEAIADALGRDLDVTLALAAVLWSDAAVAASVARGVPVMQLFPGSGFAEDVRALVDRWTTGARAPRPAPALLRAPRPAPRGGTWLPVFQGGAPGTYLRRCRELQGISLAQLHERTRIRHHHLESIEADRYDRLPPDFYVIQYVRQIADAVGVADADAIARVLVEGARKVRAHLATRPPRPLTPGAPAPPSRPSRRAPRVAVPQVDELMALCDFEPELDATDR